MAASSGLVLLIWAAAAWSNARTAGEVRGADRSIRTASGAMAKYLGEDEGEGAVNEQARVQGRVRVRVTVRVRVRMSPRLSE